LAKQHGYQSYVPGSALDAHLSKLLSDEPQLPAEPAPAAHFEFEMLPSPTLDAVPAARSKETESAQDSTATWTVAPTQPQSLRPTIATATNCGSKAALRIRILPSPAAGIMRATNLAHAHGMVGIAAATAPLLATTTVDEAEIEAGLSSGPGNQVNRQFRSLARALGFRPASSTASSATGAEGIAAAATDLTTRLAVL